MLCLIIMFEYVIVRVVLLLECFCVLYLQLCLYLLILLVYVDLILEWFDLVIWLGCMVDFWLCVILFDEYVLCVVVVLLVLFLLLDEVVCDDLDWVWMLLWLGYLCLVDLLLIVFDGSDQIFVCNLVDVVVMVDNVFILCVFVLVGVGVMVLLRWLIDEDFVCGWLLLILCRYCFLCQGVYVVFLDMVQFLWWVQLLLVYLCQYLLE